MGGGVMGRWDIEFTLTEDHVKLLRHMYVGWGYAEYGAPEIDPKRPYGNSNVEHDIAEILGWEFVETVDGPMMTPGQPERAAEIHKETETALQVVLRVGAFEPGVYVADKYRRNWRRKGKA